MHFKRQIYLILFFTGLVIALISYISLQEKNNFIHGEVKDFQRNQLSYVKQVAEKVEFRLGGLHDDLYALSQRIEVQFLRKNSCLLNMIQVFRQNSELINAIYRMDDKKEIRYGYPRLACPVVGEQLDAVFEQCRLTGKTFFRVMRRHNDGRDLLVIARPVYTIQGDVHLNPSNKFAGIVFFTTSLNYLQEYFFSAAGYGERGYPWFIDENRLLICTANESHRGKRFDEFLSRELPGERSRDIRNILARMQKKETGVGRYGYALHDNRQSDYMKLVAFTPLELPDQTWSIAVSNLLSAVEAPLHTSLSRQRVYISFLFCVIGTMAAMAIFLIRKNHAVQVNRLRAKDRETLEIRKEWQFTFDAIDSMVVLLDKDLKIIRANQATSTLCRTPMADLDDRSLWDFLFEKESAHVADSICQTLTCGRAYSEKIWSDRLQKRLLFTALPAPEGGGRRIKVICYAKDITQMDEIQEQLDRARKMESVGAMAGGVAHELNNILSAVVGYPEILLMELSRDSDMRPPIEAIQEAGRRASDVVADMLTVARGVAAERVIEDMNALIDESLEMPAFKAIEQEFPGVSFTVSPDPDLFLISCSAVHIKKCLMNLIRNAAESVAEGGCVEITTTNYYLDDVDGLKNEHPNLSRGEYVVLSVSDTGPEISDMDLSRIFEPFYTCKNMGRSGTGLGLAVVWNILEEHGGTVKVKSGDAGTTFQLFFPARREAVRKPAQGDELDVFKGNGEKILVVDDESRQRDIATRMLGLLGYDAVAVASGEEAVARLAEDRVDLVLLDMMMEPGINGRQTYEKILKICPGQKAVIATGFAAGSEVDKTLALGAGQLIKKPYLIKQLAQAVQNTLRQ